MSAWDSRANEIFADAAAIVDTAAREQLLAERCGADTNLRRHVDSLLAANDRAAGFLNGAAVELPRGDAQTVDSPGELIGTYVGSYRILQEIGEGGFGVVYMAEQKEPVRRKVALKIIKPGMDSREIVARFEAERQALAMMDHPNIAKVLDAGSIGTKGVRNLFPERADGCYAQKVPNTNGTVEAVTRFRCTFCAILP